MNGQLLELPRDAAGRPAATAYEPAWSRWLAAQVGGVAEYRTIDGSRVDVLTDSYAAEIEWVKKWKESIGQALFYACMTGRSPMVVLLTRGHEHERLYLDRCRIVCERAGVMLRTVSTVAREPDVLAGRWRLFDPELAAVG
jgi:hypothetical protein